ncbi:MAG TPA: tRNA (adenosine(37)-N6)-threonylcarbamoyltransferase complex dimerization subunit type 1 TsaB [Thermomicrobiales bacterium]
MLTNSSAPRQTWILAIDTSSEQAGIALAAGSHVAETVWSAGRDQTATVLNEIDCLRRLVGIEVMDLSAVAVTTGPGMFNGLRVGLSIAKGFVLGLDLSLIGVPTLDVVAYPYARFPGHIVAVVAAGRGRLVWAVYEGGSESPRLVRPAYNGVLAELVTVVRELGAPTIVTGELIPEQEQALRAEASAIVPPPSARLRRALALAEIARTRLEAGDVDDPVTLEPTYLHGPSRPVGASSGSGR